MSGIIKFIFISTVYLKKTLSPKKSLPLACSHPGHHGTVLSVSVRWRFVQTARSLWSTREDFSQSNLNLTDFVVTIIHLTHSLAKLLNFWWNVMQDSSIKARKQSWVEKVTICCIRYLALLWSDTVEWVASGGEQVGQNQTGGGRRGLK